MKSNLQPNEGESVFITQQAQVHEQESNQHLPSSPRMRSQNLLNSSSNNAGKGARDVRVVRVDASNFRQNKNRPHPNEADHSFSKRERVGSLPRLANEK